MTEYVYTIKLESPADHLAEGEWHAVVGPAFRGLKTTLEEGLKHPVEIKRDVASAPRAASTGAARRGRKSNAEKAAEAQAAAAMAVAETVTEAAAAPVIEHPATKRSGKAP